jgi:zinc protease
MIARRRTIIGALVLLVPFVCAAQGRDTVTISYDVNGLRVIQHVTSETRLESVNLYLIGGDQQLTPATAGIERLTLDAAARGTRRYPASLANRALQRTGSTIRVTTGRDWTTYACDGLADQFDSTWAVFADRIVAPTLDSASVATANARLRLDARRRRQSPETLVRLLADSIVFAGHPYALDPDGTDASLGRITASDVQRYAATQFVTSRMLLVVIGPLPRDAVEPAVAATLGTLPHGTYRWTPPPPLPHHDKATLTVVARPFNTNYLLGYFYGPPVTDRDYATFRVATDLLSGRLYRATARQNLTIRPDPTLSYGVSAPSYANAFALGAVYGMIDSPSLLFPVMRGQIRVEQVARGPGWAWDDFRDQYTIRQYLTHEGGPEQANALARAQIYRGDYRLANAEVEALTRVTQSEVEAATRYYMRRIQFVYVGAPADLDPSELDGF